MTGLILYPNTLMYYSLYTISKYDYIKKVEKNVVPTTLHRDIIKLGIY